MTSVRFSWLQEILGQIIFPSLGVDVEVPQGNKPGGCLPQFRDWVGQPQPGECCVERGPIHQQKSVLVTLAQYRIETLHSHQHLNMFHGKHDVSVDDSDISSLPLAPRNLGGIVPLDLHPACLPPKSSLYMQGLTPPPQSSCICRMSYS